MRAQGISNFVRNVFGVESFLQQRDGVSVAKAELGGHCPIVELKEPELQPAPLQKGPRHPLIKVTALHAGESSRLALACPPHLMQRKQCLQVGVKVILLT